MLDELKYSDYDKFLAVNFAPEAMKEPLKALFSFHAEIEKIPAEVSEPMVGKIKLQWWRDVINEILEGKPSRPHPVLLALKDTGVDYAAMLGMLDRYEDVLDGKLPQQLDELKEFLMATEVRTLEIAAELLGKELNKDIALAYACNRYSRKLLGKNDALGGKLIEESQKLLPDEKTSVFGAIARFYNRKPQAKRWKLAFSLLAGKYELL